MSPLRIDGHRRGVELHAVVGVAAPAPSGPATRRSACSCRRGSRSSGPAPRAGRRACRSLGRSCSPAWAVPIRAGSLHAARSACTAAPVREQRVVDGVQELGEAQLVAGRVPALDQPRAQEHLRLVERHPVLDPVAEALGDGGGVAREPLADVAVQPAAAVIERQRQVPVVERHPRRDVRAQQLVDQPVVEVEPLGVQRPGPVGEDARPRDAEAVGLEPQRLHDRDVFLVAVVVVAGDVAAAGPSRSRPASCRTCPRSTAPCRRRSARLRSGTRRRRLPRRSRAETPGAPARGPALRQRAAPARSGAARPRPPPPRTSSRTRDASSTWGGERTPAGGPPPSQRRVAPASAV